MLNEVTVEIMREFQRALQVDVIGCGSISNPLVAQLIVQHQSLIHWINIGVRYKKCRSNAVGKLIYRCFNINTTDFASIRSAHIARGRLRHFRFDSKQYKFSKRHGLLNIGCRQSCAAVPPKELILQTITPAVFHQLTA